MTYTDRPISTMSDRTATVVSSDYQDRVRWGPIFAGLAIALSTQLVLSAIGAAIGSNNIAGSESPRSDAGGVGAAVGVWSIVSLLISLFVGGWMTTRTCGPMNRSTALLNGAILWAATLAVSAWLLSSGVSGAFGVVGSNAGAIINQAQQSGVAVPANTPNVTAKQTREIANNVSTVSWSFALGSLLGLAAALTGSVCGARTPRSTVGHDSRQYSNE
ncbi:MAG: hypothetical protein LH631_04405 [Alkalinema sp. CAN_BIN05]|nr:hypothetical protein [Alkalinema sp. CAN_BIN05]